MLKSEEVAGAVFLVPVCPIVRLGVSEPCYSKSGPRTRGASPLVAWCHNSQAPPICTQSASLQVALSKRFNELSGDSDAAKA